MKKTILSIILICLSIFSFGQYSILDSLILYYPFDGNANDWSGYHFDGTVSGASLTTDHQGNANHAYSFDGVNDYIDLPNDPKLHPDFPFTIAAWIKPEYNSTNPLFNIIGTEYTTNHVYVGAWLNVINQYLQASTANGGVIGNSSFCLYRSSVLLSYNTWYYVVGIYEGVASKKIYINCMQDNTASILGSASTYVKNLSLHGSIGRYNAGNPATRYAKGIIDEVAIWNRALDPDEIPQLCETDIWQIMQMKAEAVESQSFSIFPNPMTTKAEIYFPNPNKEMHTIKVYSISGQEIVSWENINTEVFSIERGNLANGMYIVELYNTLTNRSVFEKLILH
jgi:hypothetical protein